MKMKLLSAECALAVILVGFTVSEGLVCFSYTCKDNKCNVGDKTTAKNFCTQEAAHCFKKVGKTQDKEYVTKGCAKTCNDEQNNDRDNVGTVDMYCCNEDACNGTEYKFATIIPFISVCVALIVHTIQNI
ncbi:uncharacterized protein LOC141911812 [Tubulanus polymorphus]|uniref:uncharacterized protein LOC141911812 n=1 Tax=Tubulanus polymorphus TaxID=672921 RepID=UPI003DA2453E